MKMRAAVVQEYNKLKVEELEILPPHEDEILVKYAAGGVCPSDLNHISGKKYTHTPAVLGHEAAGIVQEVGANVTHVKPGDHVAITFNYSCGHCEFCKKGKYTLCPDWLKMLKTGLLADGTSHLRRLNGDVVYHSPVSALGEYGVVPASQAVKIPDEIPLKYAALFGWSIMVGLGMVFNYVDPPLGASAAVFGCGGTGLNAVQGCRIAGAEMIIAVDVDNEKLALAKKLGATHTINVDEFDPIEKIKELTDGAGVDNAYELVGTSEAMYQAYMSLKRGGAVVLGGAVVSDPDLIIDSTKIPYEEKTMVGTSGGGMYAPRDIPRTCKWYLEGKLMVKELVTKEYTIDQAAEAFEDLKNGDLVRGLIVYE